nr:retrovirus-related Pol polyprotein from transposon TNT 1-94 [Tanacetum cinerariifolium]
MPFRKKPRDSMNIVQICLWIIDSGCSKHMTGNRALLTNFVEKFLGTVRFGNNDFSIIVGYGDVVIGERIPRKGQNRIKTEQKRKAWRSREKSEAVTVDKAEKTEEDTKRRAKSANAFKVLQVIKERRK